jgi:hypothetical protein
VRCWVSLRTVEVFIFMLEFFFLLGEGRLLQEYLIHLVLPYCCLAKFVLVSELFNALAIKWRHDTLLAIGVIGITLILDLLLLLLLVHLLLL